MSETEPRYRKEDEVKNDYGISLSDLEKNDGERMLDVYKIYRETIPGSILTVEPERLPRTFITKHVLPIIQRMEDSESEDARLNWGSDLSSESYLWASRIPDGDELKLRFSFNIADFIYLSDDAKNEATKLEKDFDRAVNEYLEDSGVGIEI